MSRKIDNRVVRTYTAEAAITAHSIVVWGTNDDAVKLPGGADAGAIVGISLEAQATAGEQVQVVVAGSAELLVKAASPNIAKGNAIFIHGTSGYGKTATLANAQHAVGYAEEAATADDVRISVEISKFSTPAA